MSSNPTYSQLSKMKKAELQALLEEKAASTTGTKSVLMSRLLDIINDEEYLISQVEGDDEDSEDDAPRAGNDEEYNPPPPPEDDDDEEWNEAEILDFADDEEEPLCSCSQGKYLLIAFMFTTLAFAGHMQCTTSACKKPEKLEDIEWLNYRISGANFSGWENMGFNEWKALLPLKNATIIVAGLVGLVMFGRYYLINVAATTGEERRKGRSWTVIWFLASGVIHLWYEGSFVFFRHHDYMKMEIYMVADWRYGPVMEPGTRAMEAITVLLDGPLCLLAAYAVVKDKVWRHPVQFLVSTMQIYGLLWFSLHPMFDNSVQHLSNAPFLFLGIALVLNMPWAIFPPMLWVQSWNEITDSFASSRNPFGHLKED